MYGGGSRRRWNFMLHGSAFGQFIYEPGENPLVPPPTRQLSSVNWGMVMARAACRRRPRSHFA